MAQLVTLQSAADGSDATNQQHRIQRMADQRNGTSGQLDRLQSAADQSNATTQQRSLQGTADQRAAAPAPMQRSEQGGLPQDLAAGVESLSGVSMEGVAVHRNSAAPAQIGAAAYAQGRDIHLGPGQERHLPHEAWHVAQQAQGRVKATTQAKGAEINDDPALEAEADRMGEQAQMLGMRGAAATPEPPPASAGNSAPIQGRFGFEIEVPIFYTRDPGNGTRVDPYGTVLDQGAFEIKADHNLELLPLAAHALTNQNGDVDLMPHGPPIIEMVTKPIDEFEVSEQNVHDLGENMANWINAVHGAVSDGETVLGGDRYVGSDSPRRTLQSTLGYFQATYGIQLSAVPLMFDATARASEKNEADKPAKIEQLKAAAMAAPAIVNALLAAQDDNGALVRDLTAGPADAPTKLVTPKDLTQVGGLGSLMVNYLIADPVLHQANLAKNAVGDYFYKSDLGDVAGTLPAGILNLLRTDDTVFYTFRDAVCAASGRGPGDDLFIGVTVDAWVNDVILGNPDGYLDALKNPDSDVLDPEDIGPVGSQESAVIMENREPQNLDPASKDKRKEGAEQRAAFFDGGGGRDPDELKDFLSQMTDPKKYPPDQWADYMVLVYKLLRQING